MNMLVDGKELKEYPDRFFEVQNPYPEYKRKGPWEWRYRTDDLTLFEYPEGQEERERWPRRVNTSRYVEGRPGQRYTFRFHFGANFVFKDTDVYVRIYADDQFTDGMHVKKAGFLIPRGHTFSKDTACYRERGMSVKPNYHFVDIEMSVLTYVVARVPESADVLQPTMGMKKTRKGASDQVWAQFVSSCGASTC